MEQECVYESEYGRGCADSEGEGQDGESGEDGRSAETAKGRSEIAGEVARQVIRMLVHHDRIRTFVECVCDQDWLRKVKICK